MARTVLSGNIDLGTVEFNTLSGQSAINVTDILDEDAMGSDSATALATQQSIKAYVDNNAGGVTLETTKAFLTATNMNSSTAYTQRNIFPVTGSLAINQGSFTSTTAGIAVPSAGIYICMFNIPLNGAATRLCPEVRFSINGTGQSESSACTYIRNASGHNDSSAHMATIYSLSASDVIGLQSRQTAGAGTCNNTTAASVTIYRVS